MVKNVFVAKISLFQIPNKSLDYYDKRKFRKGNLLCVYLGGCLIHTPLCNHRVYSVMLLCVFCVHLFIDYCSLQTCSTFV